MAFEDPLVSAQKRRAAAVSLGFNLLSTLVKGVAALLTGSVALLSEAVHSTTDVIASVVAFVSIRVAAAPPDEEHPYGHGKVESLAGFGESILLLLIVLYIVFESIVHLLANEPVRMVGLGLWVMALSTIGATAAGLFVSRIGRETNSLALQSNGQHLRVDAITSVGVFAALLTTWLTKWNRADAIFAMILAIWVGFGAYRLAVQALQQLIDRRLPDDEVLRIREIIASHEGVLNCHRLRTRLSGAHRYIDFHIVVPNDLSLVAAHDLADRLETAISRALVPAHVVIHVDPYDESKEARRNME